MRAALLIPLVLLTSCARPLTPAEKAFAHDLHGSTINTNAPAIVADIPMSVATFKREKRARLACRERIFPEPKSETVTVSPAAVVLWNTAYFSESWYRKDFLKGYPDKMNLMDAMLFAHEITHVWQWQNRATTGYSPWRAAQEHEPGGDPYLFDISTATSFLDYGYEQQASIVEEYVCCAMLDPDAPRTERLASLISQAIPVNDLPIPSEITLPWKGAQIQGICG
ncbi:hypothetical protein SAMN05444000_1034 [Shimia gijangensis]|uniref:DUF4157 domain-containing protein n=1 Tax=Shimia gijangensis TaxID=1470563 RepID=A0A1M6DTL3_9RHOB|nr:hypothetical protein [Shimia gijangensis]SHI76532.1 hypothetical protein SAMN05444000_1034 [Shimia gijangensis]